MSHWALADDFPNSLRVQTSMRIYSLRGGVRSDSQSGARLTTGQVTGTFWKPENPTGLELESEDPVPLLGVINPVTRRPGCGTPDSACDARDPLGLVGQLPDFERPLSSFRGRRSGGQCLGGQLGVVGQSIGIMAMRRSECTGSVRSTGVWRTIFELLTGRKPRFWKPSSCLDVELWDESVDRSVWYPSGDDFGTSRWPSAEEIERLLVSVR